MKNKSRLGRVLLPLAIVLAAVTTGGRARAQLTDPDPYHPWNWATQPFAIPMPASANPAIPNQGRVGMIGAGGGAYVESIDGAGLDLFGRGVGRLETSDYDSAIGLDRSYRPNATVDRGYYEGRQALDKKYFDAINEKDPKRRAVLLKQWEDASRRAALSISTTRRRRSTTNAPSGTAAAVPPVAAPRATAPSAVARPRAAATTLPTPGTPTPRANPSLRVPDARSSSALPSEVLRRSRETGRPQPTEPPRLPADEPAGPR
jgi:hypothetical protein